MKVRLNGKEVTNKKAKFLILLCAIPVIVICLLFIFGFVLPFIFVVIVPLVLVLAFVVGIIALVFKLKK